MLEHLDLLCKINLAECYIALRSGYGFHNTKEIITKTTGIRPCSCGGRIGSRYGTEFKR